MRLLVTRALTPSVEARVAEEFDTTFRNGAAPMTADEARAALADYDGLLVTLGDKLSAEAFAGQPRARMVANFGVGYNHIDVAAARVAGVTVSNTPGAVTDATADIALTLILMSARRASAGERYLRSGVWTGWTPTQFLGHHVTGKRVGIIGLGRIGKAIARRCHYGFGMEVVFHNHSAIADPGLPARQLTMDEVLATADFVVLAVPATPQTRHLIGAVEIAKMQPHAHLINIARGDIIDEPALIAAMQAGVIAGAGLDVYEHEPHVPEALRVLDNVTLLPHLGTAALEVRDAMGLMALDNLIAFRDGTRPPNAL
ncbi:2-hydroxyacid dehydrogenase [Sedimentimonas flavescens]|uniref:2-hydroxyacid dehydrogenase n=1 Tax=Sedimentimonas flavescens TaxID=2851012 RepID=UPI0021A490F9|nr:D-glycerate dehydrogenase [Sedimentimonas flavescens]MCT2539142.1 D-glycerate dehydrogenase [Sedimentimonas flavescens]WBL32413.1 D-glycerate dehydrogenase [Sinirhodobacter sp. HNIBRBA609]